MPSLRPACVLTSGGVDSAVLLSEALKAHRPVHPVYVRGGHRWEAAELHWLRRYLKALRRPALAPLHILSMPTGDLYAGHWSLTGRRVPGARSADGEVYLPGRNVLLLAKAAAFCALRRIPVVYIGPLKGNPFPDSTPRFFRAEESALAAGLHYNISIAAPFLRLTKAEVVSRGRGLPLHLTFSCLSPRGLRPCGRCNKCEEKRRVLARLSPSSD
jgi:7-cyano-7-deazaguanine synthase